MVWLVGYASTVLLAGRAAWASAPVQLSQNSGVLRSLGSFVAELPVGACIAMLVGMVGLAVWFAWKPHWTIGVVLWLLFRAVGFRMWLASNGGVQLMENMLLWLALMHLRSVSVVSTMSFWTARLQLLLAYAAAAAHKFTGSAWLDGSAVASVAADPQFDLGWLSGAPRFCTVLTYTTLVWMLTLPLAVWWRRTKYAWLLVGVIFHLCTAVFMGIPQMGLAFIACYALWSDERDAERLLAWFRGRFQAVVPSVR